MVNRLTHAEFLELILQDELAVRGERLVERRTKAAAFREVKTLDQFNFAFNPSINKQQTYELATCRFIREARDVLWLGPPGVGKSFLVQALGYQAIFPSPRLIVTAQSSFPVSTTRASSPQALKTSSSVTAWSLLIISYSSLILNGIPPPFSTKFQTKCRPHLVGGSSLTFGSLVLSQRHAPGTASSGGSC